MESLSEHLNRSVTFRRKREEERRGATATSCFSFSIIYATLLIPLLPPWKKGHKKIEISKSTLKTTAAAFDFYWKYLFFLWGKKMWAIYFQTKKLLLTPSPLLWRIGVGSVAAAPSFEKRPYGTHSYVRTFLRVRDDRPTHSLRNLRRGDFLLLFYLRRSRQVLER